MSDPKFLEAATTKHSCAIAAIISAIRAKGGVEKISQEEILKTKVSLFPAWQKEEPGCLTTEEDFRKIADLIGVKLISFSSLRMFQGDKETIRTIIRNMIGSH